MTETKISSTDAREFFGHCISCATYGDVRYIVSRWGQPMGPEDVEMLGKMAVELAMHKRGWGPKPEA